MNQILITKTTYHTWLGRWSHGCQ